MRNNKMKGFTLVELLVVIAILAILATVSVVGYTSFIESANVSNDENIAAQLNHFLVALKADSNSPFYGEEINEDNIWEVTQYILEDSGLEELEPQAAKYEYHFYFDLAEGKYVVLHNDDAVDDKSALDKLIRFALTAFAEGEEAEPAPAYKVTAGNCFTKEYKYFLVDTAGDLADVITGYYSFENLEGDTLEDRFAKYLDKVANSKIDTISRLVNETVFVTEKGNFVASLDGTHNKLVFHEGATYLSNVLKDTDVNTADVTLGGDKYLLTFDKDGKVEIPAGIMLPTNSLHINTDGNKVVVELNGASWSELEKLADRSFTNDTVVVVLNGTEYVVRDYLVNYNTDELRENTDEELAVAVLGSNFPLYDFDLVLNPVDSSVVKKHLAKANTANYGYLALDIKDGFTFSFANVNKLANKPASTPDVDWSIVSLVVDGEVVTDVETFITQTGKVFTFNKVSYDEDTSSYVKDENGLLPKVDTIEVKATSNNSEAQQTYTVDIVRIKSVDLKLGGVAMGSNLTNLVLNADTTDFRLENTITYRNGNFITDGTIVLDDEFKFAYACDHVEHTIECCGHVHDESCDGNFADCPHQNCQPGDSCMDCFHVHGDYDYYDCTHVCTVETGCIGNKCTHNDAGSSHYKPQSEGGCLTCPHIAGTTSHSKNCCSHDFSGTNRDNQEVHTDDCCYYMMAGHTHNSECIVCDHVHNSEEGMDCGSCSHKHGLGCILGCSHDCNTDSNCYKSCTHAHTDECCGFVQGTITDHQHSRNTCCIHYQYVTTGFNKHTDDCCKHIQDGTHSDSCYTCTHDCSTTPACNECVHEHDASCCGHKCSDKVIVDGVEKTYVCLQCTHSCLDTPEICGTCNHVHDFISGDCVCRHPAYDAEVKQDGTTWYLTGNGQCGGTATVTIGNYFKGVYNVQVYDSFETDDEENLKVLGSIAADKSSKTETDGTITWYTTNTIRVEDLFKGNIPTNATILIFGENNDDAVNSYMNPNRALLPSIEDKAELGDSVTLWVNDNVITYKDGAWEEIQFYGTRTEKVWIAVVADAVIDADGVFMGGKRISEDVEVEIAVAKNVRDYNELDRAEGASNVLLADIRIPNTSDATKTLTIKAGTTFYGNGFTFDITNGALKGTSGIITINGGTLRDTRVIGAIYEVLELSGKNNYGSNAVRANAGSVIENCYIANTRAPLYVGTEKKEGTVIVRNTILFGGRYCNVDFRGGTLQLEGTVITINQPYKDVVGTGINAWIILKTAGAGETGCPTLNITEECDLIQYNFVDKATASVLPTVRIDYNGLGVDVKLSELFAGIFEEPQYENFVFDYNGVQYVNAATLTMNNSPMQFTNGVPDAYGSTSYRYYYNMYIASPTNTYKIVGDYHIDADNDGICDNYKCEATKHHADEDGNDVCDVCTTALTDENRNAVCGTPSYAKHTDSDADLKCDTCGIAITDDNKDAYCVCYYNYPNHELLVQSIGAQYRYCFEDCTYNGVAYEAYDFVNGEIIH